MKTIAMPTQTDEDLVTMLRAVASGGVQGCARRLNAQILAVHGHEYRARLLG